MQGDERNILKSIYPMSRQSMRYLPKEKIVLAGLMFCSLFVLGCKKDNVPNPEASVTPTVVQKVEPINVFTPEHVVNLTRLTIAIEKYKQEHLSYPVSQRQKEAWDRLFNKAGEADAAWLEALVPNYIDSIPAITNNPDKLQYVYMSNGAHYKLLVLKPQDCEFVKSKSPELIDPRRDCRAYGYWTKKAVRW
ncbi:MAG TPA: hypothetical protein VKZ76_04370 [Edaphocola sp.]|nr:hypothetical protein [Edaphocola sp.]